MPPARNTTLKMKPGAFPGSNEAAFFSGMNDWVYVAPAKHLTKRSSAFTIAVRYSQLFRYTSFQVFTLNGLYLGMAARRIRGPRI